MITQKAPKELPENPEAEASLLGAVLLDPHAYEEAAQGIEPDDLTRSEHRLVLAAMKRLHAKGDAIDFTGLRTELNASGELASVGGPQFLAGLIQAVPSVTHATSYAAIVQRTATLRRLIGAASQILTLASIKEDPREAVQDAQELLFAVSERTLHREMVPIGRALLDFHEYLEAHETGTASGVPTGFKTLDAKTGGLQRSDLVILAGRPGLGKTSLALCIVRYAALYAGTKCVVFSMEMSEQQVVERMWSISTEIDANRIRRGRLTVPELQALGTASAQLRECEIHIEEPARLRVNDVLAKCRRHQAERGLDLVVIDYLQLMETDGSRENRVQEVAEITRGLKMIARELQVPVLALSQLSRQIATRDPEPMLSDLRDSGSIEQDADVVLFLWQRGEQDRKDKITRLKIAKHRNGPTGEIEMLFDSEFTRFRDFGETHDV